MCPDNNHHFSTLGMRRRIDSGMVQHFWCSKCLATRWVSVVDREGNPLDTNTSVGEPDRYSDLPDVTAWKEQRRQHLRECTSRTVAHAPQYLLPGTPVEVMIGVADGIECLIREGSKVGLNADDHFAEIVQIRGDLLKCIRFLQSQSQSQGQE